MKKKNLLLILTIPTLILCSCGNNNSSSSKASSSSSSSSENTNSSSSESTSSSVIIVNPKVDLNTWNNCFNNANNYSSASSSKDGETIAIVSTLVTSDIVKVAQYTQNGENANATLVSEIYTKKNSDASFDEYTYVEEYDLYALIEGKTDSNYWTGSTALMNIFKSNYSLFEYNEEKKAYFASTISSISVLGFDSSSSAKNVYVRFNDNKLVDIEFDVYSEDGTTFISHGLINDFNNTKVTLPDASKAKNGLIANRELWQKAWIDASDKNNALYKGENKDKGSHFTNLYTDKAIHKSSVDVDAFEITTTSDVYYSTEDGNKYIYTKDSSGKYSKKVDKTDKDYSYDLKSVLLYFKDCDSVFSFDKDSNTYKAALINNPMEYGVNYTNIVASFSNGDLVKVTYTYNGNECSIDSFGKTSVTLPEGEDVYPDSKDSKETWDSAFAAANSEFNFSYGVSYSDNKSEKYVCKANALEYNSQEPSSDGSLTYKHNYYSLEDNKCYKYSSSDNETTWTKEESSTNYFDEIKAKLNLFKDYYSSFTINEITSYYQADTLNIDGLTYSEVSISIEDSKVTFIEYKLQGYTYSFTDFGESNFNLPTIA